MNAPTRPPAGDPPISRYPVPPLAELPEDVRARILEVQEKAGFVPNVFLAFAHRPAEFRAFFAYHDALLLRDGGANGLTKGEKEMIIVATSGANQCLYCVVAHGAILRIYEKKPLLADQVAVNYRKADIIAAPARDPRLRDEGLHRLGADRRRRHRGAAGARPGRRGCLGHRRHHRPLRPVEPDGQLHLDAAERRVLPHGPPAASAEGLSRRARRCSRSSSRPGTTCRSCASRSRRSGATRRTRTRSSSTSTTARDGTLAWVQGEGLKHTASAGQRRHLLRRQPGGGAGDTALAGLPERRHGGPAGLGRAPDRDRRAPRGQRFMLSATMIEPGAGNNRCAVAADFGRDPALLPRGRAHRRAAGAPARPLARLDLAADAAAALDVDRGRRLQRRALARHEQRQRPVDEALARRLPDLPRPGRQPGLPLRLRLDRADRQERRAAAVPAQVGHQPERLRPHLPAPRRAGRARGGAGRAPPRRHRPRPPRAARRRRARLALAFKPAVAFAADASR